MGVIVYNPLAGGVLTGKYARGATPTPGTRLGDMTVYQGRYLTETALNLVDAFVAAAVERGVTPAQLALAWVMAEPRVTCPIIGARTMAQLNDTIGGMEVHLSPEERAAIPAIPPGRWVGVDPVYDR
jgi:aryl-alcohol dehydrogenase-like predicted oxidoreductase